MKFHQSMLELYSDLIDLAELQTDQDNSQKIDKTNQKELKSNQKTADDPQNEPQNEKDEPQNGGTEVHEPQDGPQKLLDAVRMNPKITKAVLSEMLGVSPSTLKRWLKANGIVWVGHSRNGHWEISRSS